MFEFEKLVPCRGEFIRHVLTNECTGRINSPLQYDFHNLWLLMPDDCPIGRLNHNTFINRRLGRAK